MDPVSSQSYRPRIGTFVFVTLPLVAGPSYLIPSLVGDDQPFWACRSFERLRLLLGVQLDEVQKRCLEIIDEIVDIAPEPTAGQLPEEALDTAFI